MALLRELGIRVIVYIDDLLIMADSPEKARDHTLAVIFLLENLGFICSNTQKSSDDPYPGNRFPWACSPHPLNGAPPSRSENQEVAGGSQEASDSGDPSLSEGGIQGAREDDRHVKSSTSCTIVLPTDPERSDNSSGTQQPELRHPLPPVTGILRRAEAVDRAPDQMEWEVPGPQEDRHGDRVRCVPDRMGGNLPGYMSWSQTETGMHIGNTGNKDLCEGTNGQTSPALPGQHHSSGVHQSPGRDSVSSGDHSGQGSVDLVSGAQYLPYGTAPAGAPLNKRYI